MEEIAKPNPRTTLQYLILYPSLVISLAGSIPTIVQYIKAWQLDTQVSRVQIIEEQQKIWERNLDCLSQQGVYEVDGPNSLLVKVSLCPRTGDVLVRYHLKSWAPIYRWVAKPQPTDLRKE